MLRLTIAITIAAMLGFAPPSGRPPIGAAQRYEPRLYDVKFNVTVTAPVNVNDAFAKLELSNTPIYFPLLFMGSFSRIDAQSLKAAMWFDGRETNPQAAIRSGLAFNMHAASLMVDQFRGNSIRWNVQYTVNSWSSQVDDAAAAAIPWPTNWPEEVADGLKPQMYIHSDAQIFVDQAAKIMSGQLAMQSPYLAAKELVRYCVNNIQVTGDGNERVDLGSLRGMLVLGAELAAREGLGSPHDLVCVCIAMLRAAGIPARPVIGVEKNDRDELRGYTNFISWGEFYLPDTGWIPFDPLELRGRVRSMNVQQPWPDFGTMKDLNRRIPLSYHFLPPINCQSPPSPALWGWDLKSSGNVQIGVYQVQINIGNRGRGEDDPP